MITFGVISPFVLTSEIVISTSIAVLGAFVTATVYSTAFPSSVAIAPVIERVVPVSAGFVGSSGFVVDSSVIVVITSVFPKATTSYPPSVLSVIATL